MSDTQVSPRPVTSDLRLVAALVYGLYLFAVCTGITAIVGVVIAYVKRGDARGTVYESHFSNAITVFWISFIACSVFVIAVAQAALGFLAYHNRFEDDSGLAHFIIQNMPWIAAVVPVVWLGGAALFIWVLYRILRGLVRVLEDKPY